jgi:hypothetical protein
MRTACRCLWCCAAPRFEVEQPCYKLRLQYWIYCLVGSKYPLNPLKGQANLNDRWYKSLFLTSKKMHHISVMKLIWLITFRKILSAFFHISIFMWAHGFSSGWHHMRFVMNRVAQELVFSEILQFSLWIIIPLLCHTHLSPPPEVCDRLTSQHIIPSSVFALGTSSLIQHLTCHMKIVVAYSENQYKLTNDVSEQNIQFHNVKPGGATSK